MIGSERAEFRTPILGPLEVAGYSNLWIKDESGGPGGTFKDRLAERAVARATQPTAFASISYGNTALSFALRCVSTNHRFLWLHPHDFADREFGPASGGERVTGAELLTIVAQLGATLVPVNLDSYLSSDDLEDICRDHLDSGEVFQDVTEGIDEPCYEAIFDEAFHQMGTIPATVLVQFGAGVLADEAHNVACRHGSRTQIVPFSVAEPDSLAAMLYGPLWLDTSALAHHGVTRRRRRRGDARTDRYDVWQVTEREIEVGLSRATRLGISAEPSAAAALGFLERAASIAGHQPDRPLLLVNTGNGIRAALDSRRAGL